MKIALFEHYPALVGQSEALEQARELLIETFARQDSILHLPRGYTSGEVFVVATLEGYLPHSIPGTGVDARYASVYRSRRYPLR